MTPKEFAKAWFAAIDAKNFEQISRMMGDNHVFYNAMTPQPTGKEEHLGMIKMMTSALGNGTHHLDIIISDGEWVAVRGRHASKHTGEFIGVPATGKQVEFSWIDLMHIVDGKLAEEYFELNPASILQQINTPQAQ